MSKIFAVAIAALAWAYVLPANAEQLVVAVQRVLSGDSFIVHGPGARVQVRIAGIAAPDALLPLGEKSRQNLERLIKVRDVRLDCFATDELRRKICRAHVGENDIGLVQVMSGWARRDRALAGEQTDADRMAYEKAESQAKAGKRGIWHDWDPARY